MDYFIHLAILISIYAILALSLNLLAGYTGLISMATSAFMGIGAYFVAVTLTRFELNFFVALVLAAIVVGVIAYLVDFALSRFRGDYFAMGSLSIVIVASGIFVNWQSITGGPLGIANIPRPNVFGFELSENWHILGLSLLFLLFTYLICQWIAMSSFGRVLRAIREDEKAIGVFGYDTSKYKLAAFIISSALAALAGGLFATYFSYISPVSFTVTESIIVLTMIILGGLANNKGAILGAAVIVLLPELIRFVGLPTAIEADMRHIIYGLILILFMLYRPQGFLGEYKL
ncbi:MAG: branched-chain amino acid ABC transporter permease [Candidatus Saccharibacteria bacterium]